jgi:hypothetical protein
MADGYNDEIRDNIAKICFADKKAVLFGANALGPDISALLKKQGVNLYAVVDNNSAKVGKRCSGLPISKPESVLKENRHDKIVLIASRYYDEMKAQLEEWGYAENTDIFRIAQIEDSFGFRICAERDWDALERDVSEGFKLYRSIVEKYGSDVKIHLAAVPAIGDAFLISLFFETYLKFHKIERYTLLIPGESAARLAARQGIERVEAITASDAAQLLKFAMSVGFDASNIVLLHTGYIHTRIWSRLLTLKKMTWLEHCREVLLLPPETRPVHIARKLDEGRVTKFCRESGVVRNKTVILAPYTNSVREMPAAFWERLATALHDKGYVVATNIGNGDETPIKDTKALCLALEDIVGILEYAGTFVASRSGLCDITAAARCRKVILYSDEIWDFISVHDFCGLRRMGLCEDAEEYVYQFNDDELLNKILSGFDNV